MIVTDRAAAIGSKSVADVAEHTDGIAGSAHVPDVMAAVAIREKLAAVCGCR